MDEKPPKTLAELKKERMEKATLDAQFWRGVWLAAILAICVAAEAISKYGLLK